MNDNTIGPDGLRDDEQERQKARHPGPLTGIYETPPEYAARLRNLLATERRAHAETRAALDFAGLVTCEGCGNRLPSNTACPDDEDNVYTCGRCMAGAAEMERARAEKAEAERDAALSLALRLAGSLNALREAVIESVIPPMEADVLYEVEIARKVLEEARDLKALAARSTKKNG
jgi:ribosomal protein L32